MSHCRWSTISMLRFKIILLFCFLSICAFSQDKVYDWDWEKEKFVVGAGVAINGGLLIVKSKLPRLTEEQVSSLQIEDLNFLDKTATDNINDKGEVFSDAIAYGSILIPFTHYFSHHGKEEDFAVLGMAAEVFLVNSFIIDAMKIGIRRSRPFTYNENLPIEERIKKSARFSFPSGHTSNAAAFSFFSAKVFSDLHPESKWKSVLWGTAIILPATTGYLRYQSGNHFPTDVMMGYIIGASVGYLIPFVHKMKIEEGLSITPLGNGVSLTLSF